ncbi:MAG: hypothetical protein V2B20_09320 [Pseudomonadota bacterium]
MMPKNLFYAGFGFVGGCAGSLLAELIRAGGRSSSWFFTVLLVACWSAVAAATISLSLVWAGEKYNRRPKFPKEKAWASLWGGAFAGLIGGGIAQAIYSLNLADSKLMHFFFQSGCWGVAGALIGWRLARFIPNMSISKALLGGFTGGFVGGMAFLMTTIYVTEVFGRMIGLGILGASLATCFVVAETLFRSASLGVIWAPNEITTITLGKTPITIGGGDDHVYISSLPQRSMSIIMENGVIICTKTDNNQTTQLKDGSQIQVGKIMIKITATK